MMLNVDDRETWLPLQWTRPNSNGDISRWKEPTPRTCQTNWRPNIKKSETEKT